MKVLLLLTLTLLLSVLSVSSVAKDDITKELITSNGKTRAYYLYVPSTLKPGTQAPLTRRTGGAARKSTRGVTKWNQIRP